MAWRRSVFDDDAMRGPGGSSRLRFSDSGTCSEREPRPLAVTNCPANAQQNAPRCHPNTYTHVKPVVVIAFLDDIEFSRHWAGWCRACR